MKFLFENKALMQIQIDQWEIGNLKNFVYLITSNQESFVIDPQSDIEIWVDRLKQLNSKLKGVLLTHTHHDHVAGLKICSEKFNVPIYLHQKEWWRIENKFLSHQDLFHFIEDSTELKLGNTKIYALHTPGHSDGELCYLIKDTNPWSLFTGDTVFVGLVGRTDLPTGSDEKLFYSIQKIKSLPLDTIIYPGHNYGKTPTSTIKRETLENEAFSCQTIEELKSIP
jgi:glyoxylase-like metal-dependent hydrolase (beta-lactamase superfamily II)